MVLILPMDVIQRDAPRYEEEFTKLRLWLKNNAVLAGVPQESRKAEKA